MTDEHGRALPPQEAGEVATLEGFLDFQRATLAWKCQGLTRDQLRAGLAPTSMTLAGLLKHLARVEDYWLGEVVGGSSKLQPWAGVDWRSDPDWDWHSAAGDPDEELWQLWRGSVGRSRAVLRAELARGEAEALSCTHPAWRGQGDVSLRWVLVHMIEEYARHNGHADLLRESIDGRRGE